MINLLPYKEKKSIEKVRMIKIIQTIFIGLVVLTFVSLVLLVPTIITINSRLKINSDQVGSLESEGSLVSDVDLSVLEKRVQVINTALDNPLKTQITDYVDDVKLAAPKAVVIDRFASIDGVLLEVFGTAENREVLQEFINNLESNPKVDLVDSPVSNFIKNKNGTFKLTISFKTI